MRKVLVTGATGFVGGRLVRRLANAGVDLRLFVRSPERLPEGVRRRAEIVTGALGDAEAVNEAVQGVSHVLHLAALATACSSDPDGYMHLNCTAVEQLLAAARRHHVERFVHVSSVLALPPVAEARVRGLPAAPTPYGCSKTAAEDAVREHLAQGHDAVIVRPTRVYGPGPWNDANGTTRLAVLYLQGRFRVRPADGGVEANYVHVDDVAAGIEAAARSGRSGRAYMLGGENATLPRYLTLVSEVSGVRRRVVAVPPLLLLPVAVAAAVWARLGGTASLTPAWLNSFLEHRPVDIAETRADLGYEPRPLREGLQQTLAWAARHEEGPWHVATPGLS